MYCIGLPSRRLSNLGLIWHTVHVASVYQINEKFAHFISVFLLEYVCRSGVCKSTFLKVVLFSIIKHSMPGYECNSKIVVSLKLIITLGLASVNSGYFWDRKLAITIVKVNRCTLLNIHLI